VIGDYIAPPFAGRRYGIWE